MARELQRRSFTLALAESCTGGRVADALTDVPGASTWFRGSLVTYQDEAKRRMLGIAASLLEADGAVSPSVVEAMARAVTKRTGADIGAAVVGYAGPLADPAGRVAVGTVHVAVAGAVEARATRVFEGTRTEVKTSATRLVLEVLVDTLQRSLPATGAQEVIHGDER